MTIALSLFDPKGDFMTIFSEIKKDHREIRKRLRALCQTTPRQAQLRKKQFRVLKNLIEVHSNCEEEALYRNMLQMPQARPLTLEAYEEHHLCSLLLDEMDRLSVKDEKWAAKCEVLRESLEHHIQEEENDYFKKVRQTFKDEGMQKEMGDYFRQLMNERRKGIPRNKSPLLPRIEELQKLAAGNAAF